MTQTKTRAELQSRRFANLKTTVSLLTLLAVPAVSGSAVAQTNVNDGDNTAVTTQADNETIIVTNGATSQVTGSPVITVANNNVTITNNGTIRTLGTTQTVQFNADTSGGVLANVAGARIEGESRAVNIDSDDVTINNSGTIIGTGDQRNGTIYANRTANNFAVNNIGSGAVIDAGEGNSGAGISLEIGGGGNPILGVITNEGTIRGRGQETSGGTAGDGIRFFGPGLAPVYQFNGTVTNSGTIASETTSSVVAGIRFTDRINFGGTITNEADGTIYGTNNGVYFGDADHTGGVVNNAGTIRSASRAFNIDGTGLTLNNSGTIIGAGNQRNGTIYADSTAQDFTIDNSGTVDAGEDNEGAGFSVELSENGNNFTINNSGTIQGRGQASAGAATAGDGLRFERTRVNGALDGTTTGLFTGTVTNSGAIRSEATAGTTAGIRFVNGVSFQGTLTNEEGGVIYGTNNGLYFGNATPAGGADHTGGTVYNSGTITSASRALNIDGTGLVVNNLETGRIVGQGNQRNGTVYSDSTAQNFTLNNAGLIDAGEGNEGSGFAAEIAAEGNAFTLSNTGTIQGRGQGSAATGAAGDGIRIGNVGNIGTANVDITNSGAVRSEATAGTTAGIRFVNGISFQGTLTNEAGGVIYGTNNGLYFGNAVNGEGADHTGGTVYNSGTITSASRALNIDGTGLVVNNLETGRIVGQGNQRNGTIYADSTAQNFTLNNSGTVDAGEGNEGAAFSVELSAAGNDFTINNSGSIQGRGQASAGAATAGDGLRFERTRVDGALDGTTTGLFTGTITNSGTIRSEATAGTTAGIRFVNGVSFQGTLTNEEGGVIYGTNNGLYFGNATPAGGADHTGGVVNNAGTITSASRAVNIDGNGLVLNNSGRIVGQGNQRNGTVYLDGTANNTVINNSGLIDAGEGNSGSGIAIEALAGERTHTIVNSGTIQGRGEALASGETAGIRVFYPPNMMRPTVNLTVENMGTIGSETSAGILLENITFGGSITNYGTITGATAAIDTRSSLGNVVINQRAGSIDGDILTGAGDDVVNITGGTLNGDIDLGTGSNLVNIATNGFFNVDAVRSINADLSLDAPLNFSLNGQLVATGDVALQNGTRVFLDYADITTINIGTSRDLVTSGGVISGAASVQEDSFLLDFGLVNSGSALTLTPTLIDLGSLSSDSNTNAFSSAFANALTGGTGDAAFGQFANSVDALTSNLQYTTVVAAALPSLNNGVTREIYETQNEVLSLINNRVSNAAGEEKGVWGQIFGRTAHQDGAGSRTLTGYNATSFGFVLGADTVFGDASRAGVAFSYSDIDVDETGGARENAQIDNYAVSAYYAYETGGAYINGALSYAFNNAETLRNNAFGQAISGEYDIDQFSAKLNAGHTQYLDGFEVTPFASLQYATLNQDDFQELGGLNLDVEAGNVNFFEGGIGVKLATMFESGDTQVRPEVSLGYFYDFVGDSRELSAGFAGGNRFNLVGVDPSQSSFEVDAAVNIYGTGNVSFAFGYDGEFRSGFSSHSGTARLRVKF